MVSPFPSILSPSFRSDRDGHATRQGHYTRDELGLLPAALDRMDRMDRIFQDEARGIVSPHYSSQLFRIYSEKAQAC